LYNQVFETVVKTQCQNIPWTAQACKTVHPWPVHLRIAILNEIFLRNTSPVISQPEVAVLLSPGVEASWPLPVAVLATPLLVRLATAVPPALPAGAVAKLELLVLVLGVEEEVTGGL